MKTSAGIGWMLLVGVVACADSGDAVEESATGDTTQAVVAGTSSVADEYATELGVDLQRMRRTDSGLYIEDVQEGTGSELRAGQTAVVHYAGYLPDGTKFDSSHDRNEPFEVVIGEGRVIDGWDEGIPGMKVGGRRKLVIPPHLAYGEAGAGGVIPAGATLVFDVELLEIRD